MKRYSCKMHGRAFPLSQKIVAREVNMENVVSKPVEEKKEWVAPELKKVSVEDLTAHLHPFRPTKEDDPS